MFRLPVDTGGRQYSQMQRFEGIKIRCQKLAFKYLKYLIFCEESGKYALYSIIKPRSPVPWPV